MKKFLSILLTFCLMLTVMAVAFPVFAEDTYTITFVKANGTSTTGQYAAGEDIDYPALTASIYGDNVWSASETAYAEAPKTATGDITVYEYLREGVYEFDNRYKVAYDKASYHTGWGLRLNDADDNGKNVLKFTNTAETSYSNTSGTIQSNVYRAAASYDRYNSIDLGRVPAGESKTYRITVAVKREASTLPLYLLPWTNAKSMNWTNTQITYTELEIPAVDKNETGYTEYTFEFETPDYLVEDAKNNSNPKTYGNYLFLHVGTRKAGDCVAYIDYVKVEELKGSVTYVIPEGATVNGVTGDEVTINYYGDDVIEFPDVEDAEGYKSTGWIDNETEKEVENPELGKSYTLVVKELVTVTLYRGGTTAEYKEVESVPKGSYYTLPDTEFTDTSWWNSNYANRVDRFIGYEGEEIFVDEDTILHTAEAYASSLVPANTSIYGNWTRIETSTEDGSYLYKEVTDAASTTWAHNAGTRLCTRLGVIEDGNTYKISVTYKATTNVPLDFVMVISAIGNAGGTMRSFLEESKKYHTVSKDTNGWTTATFYITADPPAEVTANNDGLDDTKDITGFEALYLMVNKAAGADNVEIAIKETKVVDLGNVVEAKGASVLTEDKAEIAGSQAIRYYFDYATNEGGNGTKIMVGGTAYDVIERGFLYTNGDITHYAAEGTKVSETYDHEGEYFVTAWADSRYGYATSFQMWLAKAKLPSGKNLLTYKGITEGFEDNWAFNDETDTVTFSTYVTGIPTESYDAKMMVRGYVIFEDDDKVQHIVYSETVNRSVQGIKDALGTGNNTEH